jgi:hypothetical protein
LFLCVVKLPLWDTRMAAAGPKANPLHRSPQSTPVRSELGRNVTIYLSKLRPQVTFSVHLVQKVAVVLLSWAAAQCWATVRTTRPPLFRKTLPASHSHLLHSSKSKPDVKLGDWLRRMAVDRGHRLAESRAARV